MNLLLKIIFLSLPILISCSVKSEVDISNANNELIEKLNKGIAFFDKGKHTRSLDEFNYIILNDRGSEVGIEARYYQGEANFELEQYDDAIASYEKFLHYSSNQEKIEYIRYKICQSYFNLATTYSRDQTNNDFAFMKLQYFIDEFPNSEYTEKSEQLLGVLRSRKAQKVYETGRLYLKLKEYESAIIYFNNVIETYYDTEYADESRISIIFFYLLQNQSEEAISFYENNKDKFQQISSKEEAELLLSNYSNTSFWIKNKVRLYK